MTKHTLLAVVMLAGCTTLATTPMLPTPVVGERWLCFSSIEYTNGTYDVTYVPSVVLTRETPPDEPRGIGKVSVAGVIYMAKFQVSGVYRRWDWNLEDGTYADALRIGADGAAVYFDFRTAEPGERTAKGSKTFRCYER